MNFIHDIEISNFKSIEKCKISDCKRINLFIGRPNVGKSNIIEALSLFTIPFLRETSSKKLSNLVRLENETELFHNGNWIKDAIIDTGLLSCRLEFHPQEMLRILIKNNEQIYKSKVDENLNVSSLYSKGDFSTNIKRYVYKNDVTYKKGHSKYLIPPYGSNLLSIVDNFPELKKDVYNFFSDYGLEIAFDKSSQTIKVLERNNKEIFLIPYNSVADTLQRIIFYKAAINSNRDSVILFEEPEAHSFPPYMSHLTQAMINSDRNQFFVATHSPFILNDLLENARADLAVYNVNFKEKQTIVRRFSTQELHDVSQYGVDLFTNNESYV